MTWLDYFAERVRVYKWYPVPAWASDKRLSCGEKIRIVLHGEERVVPARALGRYERKKHVVWYQDSNGRKWRLRLPSSDVLLGWED